MEQYRESKSLQTSMNIFLKKIQENHQSLSISIYHLSFSNAKLHKYAVKIEFLQLKGSNKHEYFS